MKDNFRYLREQGIITAVISAKMEKMIGFRNIAVHEYQEISSDILKMILANSLRDFEVFYSEVVKYFHLDTV